jgi:putative DNA primase/helicase
MSQDLPNMIGSVALINYSREEDATYYGKIKRELDGLFDTKNDPDGAIGELLERGYPEKLIVRYFEEKHIPFGIKKRKNEFRAEILEKLKDNKKTIVSFEIALYLMRENYLLTLSDTEEIYIFRDGVYMPTAKAYLSKEIQELLQENCSINFVNEILGHIKRTTMRNRVDCTESPNKICLKNGILDLRELTISKHNPLEIFFNKIPVSYDLSKDCPLIKKFIGEVVREADIPLLQEFAGYCLYKNHFIHKSIMLIGSGANGKSTYINLLKHFLGPENVTSIPLQKLETNRFSVSSLFGKLANLFGDLPERALSGTSIFKMLVGQDLVPGEKKFKDEFFFTNYAKLIFSANQIPKSPEDTDAFFRRWIIIVFPNQFLDNADKNLLNKLTTPEELSGFLNFAIEGLKRLLEKNDFSYMKSLEEIRETYIRMSDSIKAFEIDRLMVDPETYISKKELFTYYLDYCREKNYPIVSENVFHRELQKKIRIEDYRPNVHGIRINCWRGIKVNNRSDQVDQVDQKSTVGHGGLDGQGNPQFNTKESQREERSPYQSGNTLYF